MANISTWSTTAASNNANPPDGAPEGMAPSAVNNTMRESMAAVRTWYEDAEWTDFGYTHFFVASTQFKIAGTDYTAEYHVGRRVRVVASTPGTIYGTITATSFSTDTTVTVAFDSGSLSNEALTVSLAALSSNSAGSVPGVKLSGDDWTFQGSITLASGATVTAVLDEDTMSSDSATALATQQSIKAYADSTQVLVQQVHGADGDQATGTTVFLVDDSIPQNTEGDEYMTLAITPTNSSNYLLIEAVVVVAHGTTNTRVAAGLFQDSTANALTAVVADSAANTTAAPLVIRYRMVAGTTSETTFKIRAGSPAAGTSTFSGASGSGLFGGRMTSSMTITEIAA